MKFALDPTIIVNVGQSQEIMELGGHTGHHLFVFPGELK